MHDAVHSPRSDTLMIGTRVEVRTRFHGSWTGGFEVADADADGYWVCRESDRYLIPKPFRAGDIRHRS